MKLLSDFKIISFFLIVLILSCKSSNEKVIKNNLNDTTKIKIHDSLDYLDLSNKDLKEFPDLSNMYVRFLNISNNKIKKVNEDFVLLYWIINYGGVCGTHQEVPPSR